MFSWYRSKCSTPLSSPGKPSGEISGSSPPKHVKQGRAEARSSLIPETDKTLSQTNPLEVGLKHVKQGRAEARSSLIPETDKTLSQTNPLEVGLKHVKQGRAEARSSLIPETDKTLSQTNPLEVGLKHVTQGKAEARSSLIPETDKTLSQTNPLEVGLKALRSSSHPQSSDFLQALERPIQIVNDLLGENQRLQKELNNSHVLLERLQANVKQLQRELQKRQSSRTIPEHHLLAENQRLQQELQELRELKNTQETFLAHLQTENQELQQELEELRKGLVPESETTAEEMPVPQSIAFPVQVQRSGETGGYEKQFLRDVAKLLNGHKVSLQVEEYQEGSEHLLLLFSTIASRVGTDIDNALNGLKSMQKVLLVVFHLKPKSNTRFFADLKPQVWHPALVGTVHACFSLQDGFYHCQINQDAVESVTATIMQLIQDG